MSDDIDLRHRPPSGTAYEGTTSSSTGGDWVPPFDPTTRNQPWTLWTWNGTAWTQQDVYDQPQPKFVSSTQGGVTHMVPDNGLAPIDTTLANAGPTKTRAEVIASQYATVGGRDVYIETDAEQRARQQGLYKDNVGYYKLDGSKRDYVTAIDPDSGRRWHLDQSGAKVWDDIDKWPAETGTPAELQQKRREATDRLAALRTKYKSARADAYTYRNNLLVRIRDQEDLVNAISRAIGDDAKQAPTITLTAAAQPKFDGGVKVEIDYARWHDGEPLSFSNPLREVEYGDHVVVRASITFGDRKWRPGMLAAPEMCRVTWSYPTGAGALKWEAGDTKIYSTDEYICSNPLVLMRDFYAPKDGGNTFTGRGSTNSFGCKVEIYEIVLGDVPDHTHVEGMDGIITSIDRTQGIPPPPPDDGGAGSTDPGVVEQQLLRFMEATRWVESSCNYLKRNSIGCIGAYQFCGTNWHDWSIKTFGTVRDWTIPSNQDQVAHKIMKSYYLKTLSWLRVSWMWHSGYGRWDDKLDTMGSASRCYTNCVMILYNGGGDRADGCGSKQVCVQPGPSIMGTCCGSGFYPYCSEEVPP